MLSSGSASTVTGIFDNNLLEGDSLSYVGVVSAQPPFVYATADLPNGAIAGDVITVDGTACTVCVI